MDILNSIRGKIVVSVQAMPDEPLYKEECMKAMMASVINGGVRALRVAGSRDVKNAKEMGCIVIGLTKPAKLPDNWMEVVYITPTLDDAKELINAGADIIAFDGTLRQRPNNCNLNDMIDLIHTAGKLAMADISTFEEGIYCAEIGADIISTTLSGYTVQSAGKQSDTPDFELLERLSESLEKPIILEGRIWEPEDVKKAFMLGAYSVVIGSAITRPQLITKRFVDVLN